MGHVGSLHYEGAVDAVLPTEDIWLAARGAGWSHPNVPREMYDLKQGGSDIKVRYDAGTSNAERDNSDGKEEACAPQPAQARVGNFLRKRHPRLFSFRTQGRFET